MKKLILFISFIFSINFIYSQNTITDTKKLVVRDSAIFNRETLKITGATNEQYLKRISGRWVNSNLRVYSDLTMTGTGAIGDTLKVDTTVIATKYDMTLIDSVTGIYHANRALLDAIDPSDTTRWGTSQNLTVDSSSTNYGLAITGGNRVTFNKNLQDLSLTGNTLSLSGDATTVDLSAYVNPSLTNYVTLNGTQTITGLKTFSGGAISGITIQASSFPLIRFINGTNGRNLSRVVNDLTWDFTDDQPRIIYHAGNSNLSSVNWAANAITAAGTVTALGGTSTNWNTAYSNRINTFTTTGNSGSATFSGNTLNIPNYTLSGLGYSIPTLQQVTTAGNSISNQIASTVATGTAPLTVASATLVTNLNADLLDGQHGSYYATATGSAIYKAKSDSTATDGYVRRDRLTSSLTTKENAFTKNTAFNKNFGTGTGTVLEGRTFGTAANSASTDFAPSSHTLDSHSNVTITANASGELLKWNGTAWVNNTLAEAGIQASGTYSTDIHSNITVLTNTTAAFTTSQESKLSGIAAGAEVNVNADWNAVSGDAQIMNKPTIPTNTNQLTNGAGFITNSGLTGIRDSIYQLWVTQQNNSTQTLVGTSPYWNVQNGKNATITLTGATTVLIANLVDGMEGSLYVVNGGNTSFRITFSGYTTHIYQSVHYSGDTVAVSGSTAKDIFTWKYIAGVLVVNGTLNLQ